MTAAFVALTMSLAIHSTGQGYQPESLPYYYHYQKKHRRSQAEVYPAPRAGRRLGLPQRLPRWLRLGRLRP